MDEPENTTPPKGGWLKVMLPLVVAVLGAWFDYRIKFQKQQNDSVKERSAASYQALAPALKELQAHAAAQDTQLAVLQQLVLVLSQNGRVRTVPALDTFKRDLVVKVQKSQGKPALPKALPEHLSDLPAAR